MLTCPHDLEQITGQRPRCKRFAAFPFVTQESRHPMRRNVANASISYLR